MICPQCNSEISPEHINIQKDIAQCPNCSHVFSISSVLHKKEVDTFDMENPPSGAWLNRDYNGLIIGASTRSPIAWFLVPFMIVWSGGSLGGIYGLQIIEGEFNLMLSLFGIPFILGSILFWSFALMAIFGKVELKIDNDTVHIITGIGNFGLKSSFNWNEVSSISESGTVFRYPGSRQSYIQVDGKRRVTFGSGLSNDRRYFLYKSLQKLLNDKVNGKRIL